MPQGFQTYIIKQQLLHEFFVCIVTQWRMGLVGVKQRGNEQMLQWKKMTCGNRHNKTLKNLFRRTGMSQEKVISKGSLLPYTAKDCRLGPQTRSHGCQRATRNVLRAWGIGTFLSHGKTDPPEGVAGCTPQQLLQCGTKLQFEGIYLHPLGAIFASLLIIYSIQMCIELQLLLLEFSPFLNDNFS